MDPYETGTIRGEAEACCRQQPENYKESYNQEKEVTHLYYN